MKPLDTNQAIWLARGEALGIILRLLQRGLRASARRLRNIGRAERAAVKRARLQTALSADGPVASAGLPRRR